MLRGILVDFGNFLCILALFWAAYGIGAFAMMRPLKSSVGLDSHHWMYDIASMILGLLKKGLRRNFLVLTRHPMATFVGPKLILSMSPKVFNFGNR